MKITVVFEDNVMIVDDEPVLFEPNQLLPNNPDDKVIQWDGESGYIERKLKEPIFIENFAMMQPFIQKYLTRRAELQVHSE